MPDRDQLTSAIDSLASDLRNHSQKDEDAYQRIDYHMNEAEKAREKMANTINMLVEVVGRLERTLTPENVDQNIVIRVKRLEDGQQTQREKHGVWIGAIVAILVAVVGERISSYFSGHH